MLERPEFPTSYDELVERYSVAPDQQARLAHDRQKQSADDAARRARASRIAYAKRVSDCGERFSERTFANYFVPPGDGAARAAAKAYAEDIKGPAPWFYGPPGIGKSHVAAAIVNDVSANGIPAVYTTALGMLDRIKATYDRSGNVRDGEHDLIGALARMPVLVLDDLDKAVLTEWSAQRLYVLVNTRYEGKRGIVITSNLSPADLQIAWEQRLAKSQQASELLPMLTRSIFDRVLEMNCLCRMSGESQRGLRS